MDSLIEELKDESSDVRGWAAYALGEIGSERALDFLIEALADESSLVREGTPMALSRIGSEKAVDPLKNALKDEGAGIYGKVKDRVFNSLEKIDKKKLA
jgi:HEAT repeat protein